MATPLAIGQPALALPHAIVTDGMFPAYSSEPGSYQSNFTTGFIIQTAFETHSRWTGDGVRGLAPANGELLSWGSNAPLMVMLGNIYGGDARGIGGTYALPDLQGAAPLFLSGTGRFPSYGATQGNPANTVSLTQQQLPSSLGGESAPISNEQYGLGMQYLIQVDGSFPVSKNPAPDTIGMVYAFAGALGGSTPAGFLPADGRLLNVSDYESLYMVLGTMYGGDGANTFALPDLRNRVPIGAGVTSGGQSIEVGQTLGSAELVVSSSDLPGAGDSALQTLQPSLAMNYVIVTEGVYRTFGDEAPMLGQIGLYAGRHVPEDWTLAQGQVLSVGSNPALFSLTANAFGGSSFTTFALPDLRGRTAIGTGGELKLEMGDVIGSATQTLSLQNLPDIVVPVPTATLVTDSGEPVTGNVVDTFKLDIDGLWPQATVEYSTDGQTWRASYTPDDGSNSVMIRQVAVTGQASLPSRAITFELDGGSGPPPEFDLAQSAPDMFEDEDTGTQTSEVALTYSTPLPSGGREIGIDRFGSLAQGLGTDAVDVLIYDMAEDIVLPEDIENVRLIEPGLDNTVGGNSGDNLFEVVAGDWVIEGNGGQDTVRVNHGLEAYQISQHTHGGQLQVTLVGPEGQVLAKDVQTLQFSDTMLEVQTGPSISEIDHLYEELLGRDSDVNGLTFWATQFTQGASLQVLAQAIADSDEFDKRHGAELSNEQLVEALYESILNRAPDPEGLAFWSDALETITEGELIMALLGSAESQAALDHQPVINEIFVIA